MNPIAARRLFAQHLARPTFAQPDDVVRWFGAVQGQEYPASLWALGLRMGKATEASVAHALTERRIVRTWPMRGTLHYVAAEDVRWMVALLTPRVRAQHTHRLRQLELDETDMARSRKVIGRALEGGRARTRADLLAEFEVAGISPEGQRGFHILGQLAMEGLICYGPRAGKEQTFVLVEEWLPPARFLAGEEALAEVARRYFTSHGPATVQDFVWWSGLTVKEARQALDLAKPHLVEERDGETSYWLAPEVAGVSDIPPMAYLLPMYDEYTVAYKDRSAVLSAEDAARPDAGNGIFRPPIVIGGQIVGTWTRTLRKTTVVVKPRLFRALSEEESEALNVATERYAAFLGLAGVLAGDVRE